MTTGNGARRGRRQPSILSRALGTALKLIESSESRRGDAPDAPSSIVHVSPTTPATYVGQPVHTLSPVSLTTLTSRELKRFAAVAILLTLVPAVLAGIISGVRPKVYGARVDILYESAPAATSPAQIDREFATQEIIVQSLRVLGPVAQKAGMDVADLERAVDVDVVPGTQVLEVVVGDRDASRAQDISQAIAETYIGLAITQATRQGARTSEGNEKKLESLTTRLAELESDAATAAARGQVSRETASRTQAAEVLRQIGALRDRLNLLPGSSLKGTPRVFVPAHILPEPLAPKPLNAAAAGALVGALIATAAVLWMLRTRAQP